MDFRQALGYLDSFVNYEKTPAYSYVRSLKPERMRLFLSRIGDPQDHFKSVHVAGTKGKGSVCAFCAYILRQAGCRVGLYTSPHLSDIRERLRVLEPGAGRGDFEGMIGRKEFAALVTRLKPAIDSFNAGSPCGPLSFFELYTALAFEHFRRCRVDCAVIETGLGGRLDATNVVEPVACCVTSISLDHTQKLGKTIARIAREKAGIIKPLVSPGMVVIAPQEPVARKVLLRACESMGSRTCLVGEDLRISCPGGRGIRRQKLRLSGGIGKFDKLSLRLPGKHQAENAACAVALAVSAISCLGGKVTEGQVRNGLARARWPGRFEALGRVILDGAHNSESAEALAGTLSRLFPGRKIVMVLGVSSDKDVPAICRPLLGVSRDFIVTRADNPRAVAPLSLAEQILAEDPGTNVRVADSIARALLMASKERFALTCITGSLFLVGEARELLVKRRKNA